MKSKGALSGHLKQLRLKAGLSRQAVAESLGVDRTTVAGWESGRYQPRDERLASLATLLGVRRETLSSANGKTSAIASAALVDTLDDLPSLLAAITPKTKRLQGFRLAAPYPTAAYVQTEWRAMVAKRLLNHSMEVQRIEIVYELARLKEIVSNIFRYDGVAYSVKASVMGARGIAPALGGYIFDDTEFLMGAYWTGVPPTNKPGLHMSGEPFATFFHAYWTEIWSRGIPLNLRGRHDLSKVQDIAFGLGLPRSGWRRFVEEARALEIGDGAPPLF